MKKLTRLWAKSIDRDSQRSEIENEYIFLPNHLETAYRSTIQVIKSTGRDQLKALGLEPDQWFQRFAKVVSLSATLHDLGKVNDHFQGMLQPDEFPDRKDRYQGLRHEWVTFLILQELKDWLLPAVDHDPLNWLALECAITGHHPAYDRPSPPQNKKEGSGSKLFIDYKHSDFAACLEFIRNQFSLNTPPTLASKSLFLDTQESIFKSIFKHFQNQNQYWMNKISPEEKRFVVACKTCLIAGDVSGSALPMETRDRNRQERWIEESFAAIPKPEDIAGILADRLDCVIDEIDKKLRPFQKETAKKAGRITFVKAGCGTGKTLTAYNWARLYCPGKRVYICYPTTGTASEGFRDYLFNPDEKVGKYGADLFNSRAEIDKQLILGVDIDREANDANDGMFRIDSLKAWATPIVSCTVDSVLGLIQNNRQGLYAWPALAGAAFVFDEIHSYDDHLFGALLRFLEAMRGVPVLLMTASLPLRRLEILRNKCQKLGENLMEIDGPKEIEERKRYHRLIVSNPLDEINREYERGGKILWVCNTVNRAMNSYQQALDMGLQPILYHSRFRYEDRVEQHKKVIDSFKEENNPALAICTQVAEMSLDLSATLLVTDLAPVPSLIQRLGRLNRRAKEGDATQPFIIIEPVTEAGDPEILPYTTADFDYARRWLNALPQNGVSQFDLAQAWEEDEDAKNRRPAFVHSAWLDGGPCTQVLELREGSPGITVIWEEDLKNQTPNRNELQKVLIPMNPPPNHIGNWREWKKYRGIPIAPKETIEYNEERGAKWQKKQEK